MLGLRMKKTAECGSSPFSRLPDDIVVQIYNKVMDLKTLCYCQLISKHLGSIVFHADTISFNVPLRFDYENENCLEHMKILYESFRFHIKEASFAGALDSLPGPLLGSDSFPSAINFIKKFTKIKSICIQFPSYVDVVFGVYVLKHHIKSGITANPFVIQALYYVLISKDINVDEEVKDKDIKACCCLKDSIDRLKKVLGCTVEFPLLEKVIIMDSSERDIETLSGGEIDELRNFIHSCETSKYPLIHRAGFLMIMRD